MGRTVGDLARLAGVSVRTLHHYDEIGLLEPSQHTEAGYRVYGDGDVADLQQILFFKELGFGLADIRRLMNDPSFDRADALRMQRRMLTDKARQLRRMIGAVDKALTADEKGTGMDDKDMFEVFGDFDPKKYEDEARERWGDTDAYKESTKRAARYTKEDWKRFKAESHRIMADFAELMDSGAAPDSPEAMAVAERHRLQIDSWFYPCSSEMHANLGRMYVADPRFAANYEKVRPGMAQFVRDAIQANSATSR